MRKRSGLPGGIREGLVTGRDDWARLTPFELGIPGRGFAEEFFPAIREEAESRDSDLTDPGAFILLGQVGRAIREIQGEERGDEALHRYGAFLFQAFHFHAAGERLFLLETPVARYLVDGDPALPDWGGALPSEAGYLQLPRHLFWTAPDDSGAGDPASGDPGPGDPARDPTPAEPLDGIFWTRSTGGTLSLLIAMGVREDRPGLSLMELPPAPLDDARRWPDLDAREEARDFETTLPGGELDRLYSIVNLAEVLKLVSRLFAYLQGVSGALGEPETAPSVGEVDAEAGVRPSALPFRRIRLPGAGSADRTDSEPETDPESESDP